MVCIALVRSRGTFGIVGVVYTAEGVSAIGGGVDYNPDTATTQLGEGISESCVDITIVNDLLPEDEEVSGCGYNNEVYISNVIIVVSNPLLSPPRPSLLPCPIQWEGLHWGTTSHVPSL